MVVFILLLRAAEQRTTRIQARPMIPRKQQTIFAAFGQRRQGKKSVTIRQTPWFSFRFLLDI